MITLTIPSQALHNAFRGEDAVDLRDLALFGTRTEDLSLRAPVYAARENSPLELVIDEVPTRIEFAHQVDR